MATYIGTKHERKCDAAVWKDGQPFDHTPSLAIENHSPDGFEWGYGGSGPAQLALALLYDVTGNAEDAREMAYDFRTEIVMHWGLTWTITTEEIWVWIKNRE